MSTLKLLTIEQVYEAKNIVNNSRFDVNLTPEERYELERAFVALLNIENKLMKFTIQTMKDSLSRDMQTLDDLVKDMANSAQRLAGVSLAIRKVADILKDLVNLAEKIALRTI